MKRVLLILLILIVAAGALLVLKPEFLDFLPLKPAWREQARELVRGHALVPETTRLYKWQDEHGQWQVSDQPPAAGIDYETLEYRHDVNVVPAVKPPE